MVVSLLKARSRALTLVNSRTNREAYTKDGQHVCAEVKGAADDGGETEVEVLDLCHEVVIFSVKRLQQDWIVKGWISSHRKLSSLTVSSGFRQSNCFSVRCLKSWLKSSKTITT